MLILIDDNSGQESDSPTPPAKDQQVRQIKAAEKIAARCGGAYDRDTDAALNH